MIFDYTFLKAHIGIHFLCRLSCISGYPLMRFNRGIKSGLILYTKNENKTVTTFNTKFMYLSMVSQQDIMGVLLVINKSEFYHKNFSYI